MLPKKPDHLYVDGAWVKPSSAKMIEVVNPSTEEVFFAVVDAQGADIDRAVAAARNAFDNGPWPELSHQERAKYLLAIAAKMEERVEDLATIQAWEVGSTIARARASVAAAVGMYRDMAALADSFAFQEPLYQGQTEPVGLLVREPVGVVAAVLPWNGPQGLVAAKGAPALLCGCTLIVKAPPEAPGGVYLMAEIMDAVGLPPGVFNIVTAERQVSEYLVSHPDVDKVTFTGSSATGKKIAAICGERIARVTLELGGKSPALVLGDYDIGAVAKTLAATTPMGSGQICAALTRIIVPRDKHDDTVEALAAEFAKIRVGDPFDDVDMGPLAMERQRDRVEGYFAKGRAEGAKVAIGGGRPSHMNRGYYVEPTVFAGVDNNMTIAQEEIFGPVISVIPVDSEEEGIAVANASDFGLNASVFTNDLERFHKVARRIRSGTVGMNGFRANLFQGPFGGFKQSGIGREGGVEGLHAFLETKAVVVS